MSIMGHSHVSFSVAPDRTHPDDFSSDVLGVAVSTSGPNESDTFSVVEHTNNDTDRSHVLTFVPAIADPDVETNNGVTMSIASGSGAEHVK